MRDSKSTEMSATPLELPQKKKTRLFATPQPVNGETYNLLTAVKDKGRRGHNRVWECRCRCGTVVDVLVTNLRSGNTKSCGCHRVAASIKNATKHGMSDTRIHWQWQNMIRRCTDPTNKSFVNYGARGIAVCDRWLVFENFAADMGVAPQNMTIDRKNNDLGYSPENCVWATKTQQARNTRLTIFCTINGETKPLRQWAEEAGIKPVTLWARWKSGKRGAALLAPVRRVNGPAMLGSEDRRKKYAAVLEVLT